LYDTVLAYLLDITILGAIGVLVSLFAEALLERSRLRRRVADQAIKV
jgi:hypothetical protein